MQNDGSEPWFFKNPVEIQFGVDAIDAVSALIGGSAYTLVTYSDPFFCAFKKKLYDRVGPALCLVNDVKANPDCNTLQEQCARYKTVADEVDIIVAVGGGSVIDTAKVLAAASEGFNNLMNYVRMDQGSEIMSPTPIIAVPTTAGTGSEVTSWATIWDTEAGKKYSLCHSKLYPRTAIVDPVLMLGKSVELTLATGLDALSHAFESIWNKNANPLSARYAVFAARTILYNLPKLLMKPRDLALRSSLAEASLLSGLAFSNTKTAIAHNLSYPITLQYGVTHGIACSFTLPTILRSVCDLKGFPGQALKEIFNSEINTGADILAESLCAMKINLSFRDYGINSSAALEIINKAFLGQRGRNFLGNQEAFISAAQEDGLIK